MTDVKVNMVKIHSRKWEARATIGDEPYSAQGSTQTTAAIKLYMKVIKDLRKKRDNG